MGCARGLYSPRGWPRKQHGHPLASIEGINLAELQPTARNDSKPRQSQAQQEVAEGFRGGSNAEAKVVVIRLQVDWDTDKIEDLAQTKQHRVAEKIRTGRSAGAGSEVI